MTDRERRLREFVSDPEGLFPVLRAGFKARLERETHALLCKTPDPATALAELHALHRLYLETQQLTDAEGFVRAFSGE